MEKRAEGELKGYSGVATILEKAAGDDDTSTFQSVASFELHAVWRQQDLVCPFILCP